MEGDIERRVYRKELQELTGWGSTWITQLEKKGKIPAGRVDFGGRRKWWPESEARAIVAGWTVAETGK
jgi:predicted DNA-binding transcriptional regulator AlpA